MIEIIKVKALLKIRKIKEVNHSLSLVQYFFMPLSTYSFPVVTIHRLLRSFALEWPLRLTRLLLLPHPALRRRSFLLSFWAQWDVVSKELPSHGRGKILLRNTLWCPGSGNRVRLRSESPSQPPAETSVNQSAWQRVSDYVHFVRLERTLAVVSKGRGGATRTLAVEGNGKR